MGTLAAKVTSGVFICLILLGCTQKGNILYLPDPEEPRISTAPLVTVIYDLICQGVEEAAAGYDSFLRANSHVFDDVPSADLLYLETPMQPGSGTCTTTDPPNLYFTMIKQLTT